MCVLGEPGSERTNKKMELEMMKKVLLAGASALVLALAFGPAQADSLAIGNITAALGQTGATVANNASNAASGAAIINNGSATSTSTSTDTSTLNLTKNDVDVKVLSDQHLDASFGGININAAAADAAAAKGGEGGKGGTGGVGGTGGAGGAGGTGGAGTDADDSGGTGGNGGTGGVGGVGGVGGNGGNGGNAAAAAAAAGSNFATGAITQDGNAFQNFAGVNTMTESTAMMNNNQAATSIAAYAPVAFGTSGATVH